MFYDRMPFLTPTLLNLEPIRVLISTEKKNVWPYRHIADIGTRDVSLSTDWCMKYDTNKVPLTTIQTAACLLAYIV